MQHRQLGYWPLKTLVSVVVSVGVPVSNEEERELPPSPAIPFGLTDYGCKALVVVSESPCVCRKMLNTEFTESREGKERTETAEAISEDLVDRTLDGRCEVLKLVPGQCSGERVFSFWRKIS